MTQSQRLLRYFGPHKKRIALGILSAFAANIFKAVEPIVLQQAIDNLIQEITNPSLLRYAGLITLIGLIHGVLVFTVRWLFTYLSRDIEYDLRNDFYQHLQKLPLEFFQANRTGDLMARATNDLGAVRAVVSSASMYLLNTLFSIALIMPVVARISWRLTLIAFFPLPLMIVATHFFSKRLQDRFEKVQEYFGKVFTQVHETFSGVRTIRAYTQEQPEIQTFMLMNRLYLSHNLRLIRLSSIFYPFLHLLTGLGLIAVLWYGGNLAIDGKLSIGQLLAFTLYLVHLAWPISDLGWVIDLFRRGMASMGRMHSIMSIEPTISDGPDTSNIGEITGEIEFRNLTFKYNGANRPALCEINLRIAAGQTVALVGAVGSGKSTLMNLIPRLLDAEPGQVLIDGHQIGQIPLKVLRSSIGYVPQEAFLFSKTIADNIASGVEKASQQQILIAATRAAIAEDIAEFPDGFDTIVGERGITLSGGQKQRITIARAIIRHPRILILDDALSSVDTNTEEKILKRLRKLMRGRTCLISSHRVSTVKDADSIIVLNEGRIAEQGTHDELLSRGGLYAELHEKQLLEDEVAVS